MAAVLYQHVMLSAHYECSGQDSQWNTCQQSSISKQEVSSKSRDAWHHGYLRDLLQPQVEAFVVLGILQICVIIDDKDLHAASEVRLLSAAGPARRQQWHRPSQEDSITQTHLEH